MPVDFKTTKPILLDSLHISAAIYIVNQKQYWLGGFRFSAAGKCYEKTTKPILLDSLHITAAAMYI